MPGRTRPTRTGRPPDLERLEPRTLLSGVDELLVSGPPSTIPAPASEMVEAALVSPGEDGSRPVRLALPPIEPRAEVAIVGLLEPYLEGAREGPLRVAVEVELADELLRLAALAETRPVGPLPVDDALLAAVATTRFQDEVPAGPSGFFRWTSESWSQYAGRPGAAVEPLPQIFEWPAENDTLAASQPMPFGATSILRGQLVTGDPVDFFRIDLGPGTRGLHISLGALAGTGDGRMHLVVYDATGNRLGEFRVLEEGRSLVLDLDDPDAPEGPCLYLGVAADWANDGAAESAGSTPASAPGEYFLQVTPKVDPPSPPPLSPPSGTVQPPPGPVLGPPTPPPADTPPLSTPEPNARPSTPPVPLSSGVADAGYLPVLLGASYLPTGPQPARESAPLGGVLAVGDPIPTADRGDALADASDDAPAPDDPDRADEPDGPRVEPLDLVRGAGGFPMLASALLPPSFEAVDDDLAGSVGESFAPWAPGAEEAAAVAASALGAAVASKPSLDPGRDEAPAPRPQARQIRLAASIGLHLASTCLVALALPDLTGRRRAARRLRSILDRLRHPRA